MHLASYSKRLKIGQLLLEYGAKANVERDRCETPLQMLFQGVAVMRKKMASALHSYFSSTWPKSLHEASIADLACCFGMDDNCAVGSQRDRSPRSLCTMVEKHACDLEHSTARCRMQLTGSYGPCLASRVHIRSALQ